ncbi:thiamine phosphate synthase [Roseiterribacter gracilis]|uniref:Thiamine-phosphate synthase n=1 Tax=Roseiterribacter gracilis TaxID=2812848 RepID=A0A8S8XE11_9PROT|nr:thiamine-phosphate synthase [Rhodospirillales bacterium TMPK1]
MSNTDTQLYLVTPPAFEPAAFASVLKSALDAGPVASLQIRLKPASDDEIKRAVDALQPLAQTYGVAVILNDRPDLAAKLGCDGVHIGAEDAPYAEARRIVGKDAIVGVTCKDSRHLAMEAAEAGADYVAFGAFFATRTKDNTTPADIEIVRWWAEMMQTPCVAIGGITPDNATSLVEAGADFLAVAGGVWDWPQGPADAVRRFAKLSGK